MSEISILRKEAGEDAGAPGSPEVNNYSGLTIAVTSLAHSGRIQIRIPA